MKTSISRKILAAIALLVAFFVQINFLQWFPDLSCAPNLMLIIVFSFSFLGGTNVGMATGIFCGILTDLFQGEIFGISMLLFICLGYLNGILKKYLTPNLILLPLVLCTVNEILYHLYHYGVRLWLNEWNTHSLSGYIRSVAMPEFLATLIAAVILYGVMLWFVQRWKKEEKEGKKRFV